MPIRKRMKRSWIGDLLNEWLGRMLLSTTLLHFYQVIFLPSPHVLIVTALAGTNQNVKRKKKFTQKSSEYFDRI